MSAWRQRLEAMAWTWWHGKDPYRQDDSKAIREALAEVAKLEAELLTERAANAQMREALDVAIACENAAKAELAAAKERIKLVDEEWLPAHDHVCRRLDAETERREKAEAELAAAKEREQSLVASVNQARREAMHFAAESARWYEVAAEQVKQAVIELCEEISTEGNITSTGREIVARIAERLRSG